MKIVPLLTLKASVDAPVDIGTTHAGTRRIFHATGGSFEGERLRGSVLPGGGEWFLQSDGSLGEIDVRLLLRTDDEAHIYLRYTGLMDFNDRILEALGAGRSSEFGDNLFVTQARFECSDPRYAWLTRTIGIGEGRIHPDCVEYAIYEAQAG